jgi:hypothetical protein
MQQRPIEQQYDEDNHSNVDNIADEVVEFTEDDVANDAIIPTPNAKKPSEYGEVGCHIDPIVGSIVGGQKIVDTSFKDCNQVVGISFEGGNEISIHFKHKSTTLQSNP